MIFTLRDARDLLVQLTVKGIGLRLDGDRLRYVCQKGIMTPVILTEIKDNKLMLIEALRREIDGCCPVCYEVNWWTSKAGVQVCRTCHPPAEGAELVSE